MSEKMMMSAGKEGESPSLTFKGKFSFVYPDIVKSSRILTGFEKSPTRLISENISENMCVASDMIMITDPLGCSG